jgi:hypothetical protein
MTMFGDLPVWTVVLLCLLVAGVLAAQNVGWLLWAKALLERRSRPLGAAPRTPPSEPAERA